MRTLAARCHRVDPARTAEHESVQRTHTGNRHKEIQDVSERAAKNVQIGCRRAVIHQILHRRAAGYADVIEQVDGHNDDAARDQRDRQIPFRVLELGVDRGRDDPALISKSRCDNRAKQRISGRLRARIRHVFQKDALIGNKPDDDAHDCHQKQRDQLDDGRCHLEVSRDLR